MKKEESFNYFCGHLIVIMKAKYLLFIFLATTSFYLSSCQKELSYEIGSSSNFIDSVNTADSNYLSKIYYITLPQNDTDAVSYYTYDNLKRVVSLKYTERISPQIYVEDGTNYYYYLGNDTFPFKATYVDINAATSHNDTTINFFTYAAGRRVKDSIIFIDYSSYSSSGTLAYRVRKTINTYQYPANKIYGLSNSIFTFDNGPFVSTGISYSSADTAALDISGNVISSTHTDNGNPQANESGSFTYDTHPSPFRKLSNFPAINIFPSGETFIDEMQSKNNRLHATEYQYNGLVYYNEDLTGGYSYNARGYPQDITTPDISGTFKTVFVYMHL